MSVHRIPSKASSSGESRDDRLAPVIYLPGARPAAATEDALLPEGAEEAAAVSQADAPAAGGSAAPASSRRGPERQARRAENVSLAGLTRRNMSRWEIEGLLRSREIDEQLIEAEVARLESVGLIDDAALAETLVRTQHERKGLGRQGIVSELRRRHIDQQLIDEALEQLEAGDERERARELAEKRASQLRSYDAATAERRLTAFLTRKGYSSSIVREAVAGALKGGSRSGGVRFE
ncbi:regulatory protein [Homoserinimonas aerilata]|uniref:Regulatory protein RecX n=1 Tax=Homoserinimonas aerilata TaxID=1162970 RepID=A0A542YKB7_9MICO|nr:regulatory protein RecX [Homoserinimonas aerilata]TQL48364.1 regulatory protein [Homoserinimonas aerilata]